MGFKEKLIKLNKRTRNRILKRTKKNLMTNPVLSPNGAECPMKILFWIYTCITMFHLPLENMCS